MWCMEQSSASDLTVLAGRPPDTADLDSWEPDDGSFVQQARILSNDAASRKDIPTSSMTNNESKVFSVGRRLENSYGVHRFSRLEQNVEWHSGIGSTRVKAATAIV